MRGGNRGFELAFHRNAHVWLLRVGNLAIVLVSSLLGLLLSEGLVQVIAPQELKGQLYAFAPRGYKVLRAEGQSFVEHEGTRIIYRFAPPHLRGAPAPAGAKRVLMLGDSFTEGWLLQEEESYAGRLQQRLDKTFGSGRIALLNAGTSGSGTADHLAFLEDYGDMIAPHTVVAFISIDDFGRAERSGLYRLTAAGSLAPSAIPRNQYVDAVITSPLYTFLSEHFQIMQLARHMAGMIAPRTANQNATTGPTPIKLTSLPTVTESQKQLARALFLGMKIWCDSRGVPFIVINNGWRRYDWLEEMLEADDITVFDAAPFVHKEAFTDLPSFTITNDSHPNSKGAAVTANAIWPSLTTFLVENGLLMSN